MSVVNFQDYWIAGSRLWFQRDPVNGVEQPWVDLGTINPANPTIEPEQKELVDFDGGIGLTVEESVTKITETYDITCSNLNLTNLALLFLANDPQAFTQAAGEKVVGHYSYPERLLKIHDSDLDLTNLYGLSAIYGVVIPGNRITTSVGAVTAIASATRTLTTGVNLTSKVLANDPVILHRGNLANVSNARTYTVASVTASTVVVNEPVTDEAGVAVSLTYKDNTTGTTGSVLKQKGGASEVNGDWEVYSTDRGALHYLASGLVFGPAEVPQTLNVYFSLGAIASAKRLFFPQSSKNVVRGKAIAVWSRSNDGNQTVREMTVSISPGGSAISDEDYSKITLRMKVLSDLAAANPAGRVLQYRGTLPALS